MFSIIACLDAEGGIGKENQIPWNCPYDRHFFHKTTRHSTVIMGRKTWESLPPSKQPLPQRKNIIISHQIPSIVPESTFWTTSFKDAYNLAKSFSLQIYIIGGESLYRQTIHHNDCQTLILTHLQESFSCDRYFPPFSKDWDIQTQLYRDQICQMIIYKKHKH